MTFLLMVTLVGNLAGPVGDYLGFAKGKWWAYETVSKDSTLQPLKVTVDTTADTSRVDSEFVFDGHPAYLIHNFQADSGTYDTLYETGDSLRGFVRFALSATKDTSLPWLNCVTPFQPGLAWCNILKLAADLDGNGTPDTLNFIDSARVVTQETVTVPYGTVTDAWKIEIKWTMVAKLKIATLTVYAGERETGFEWVKPGLGRLKDTSSIVAWNYGLGTDTTFTDYIEQGTVLGGIPAGIEEKKLTPPPVVVIRGTVFRDGPTVSFALDRPGTMEFSLYDATGRKAAGTVGRFPAGRSSLKLSTGNLPAGVYILIVSQDDKLIIQKKVVKVE